MRRFHVLSALALLLLQAVPQARAAAPADAAEVAAAQADAHPFAAWKKKKSPPSKGGQPNQGSKPQPAPAPSGRPAPQPQKPADHGPQRPADEGPQRPADEGSAPQAQPEGRPPVSAGDAARPAGPHATEPGPHAQPAGPAAPARPGSPAAPALTRPGATGGPGAAAVHRSVNRVPPPNMAGAHRAVQAQAHQAREDRDAQARHARDVRVSHAQAAARHAQAARHHRAAQAARAHRAWAHRHAAWAHRHHHYWWHPRPWYYGPWWRPPWAYGVFVYGPRPVYTTEVVYVDGAPPQPEPDAPRRQVDRAHTFALGLRGGTYLSAYEGGPGFTDFGLGLAGRYRATEALGFEIAWEHHDQTWTTDTERRSAPLAASVQLFAFPWTRFNPYIGTGVTWTERHYEDTWSDPRRDHHVSEDGWLFGPHLGLGLEFGLGKSAALDLEARFMGYVNRSPEDAVVPTALQTNLGLNFYF